MSIRDAFRDALETGEPLASESDAGERAVRDGAALGFLAHRRAFRIAGSDRHEFLHRMLTAVVKPASPGAGSRTLLLDNKGRLQADIDLFEEEDALLALTRGERAVVALEGLARFILRADVRIEARPLRALALVGPEARTLLPTSPDLHEGRPRMVTTRIAGREVRVAATSGLPQGLELLAEPELAPDVVEALCDAGARPVGEATLETLRIEAGVPAPEHEAADAPFPQELRLERAVAFDKGCYVGQETVARIHYRGQVNRLLCGLRLEAHAPPGKLEDGDGRTAGEVTSVASSALHGPIALGLVRREHAEPGCELRLSRESDTIGATVTELPFG